MKFSTTAKNKIQSVKCCVLFDVRDGAIKHIHRVITVEGATETDEYAVAERTTKLARELGIDVTTTDTLHVENDQLQPNHQYRVDVGKRTLMSVRKSF